MDNREIRKRLYDAVCAATPDKADDIMKSCGISEFDGCEECRVIYTKPKKKKPVYKAAGSVAALFIICIAGILLFGRGGVGETAAVINLDVNPSIQLSIDDENKVLEALSVNEDGNKILDGMDLTGTDMKIAVNAIVGSMLQQGYLNDISNSILVSVQAKDIEKGTGLQEELSASLNRYLESYALSTAVMGQYIAENDEIAEFALQNGISEGKAWLIKSLAAVDTKLSESSLLKLSTQELILLASEKNDEKTPDVSYGSVNKSQYIGKEKALQIALDKAGVKKSQILEYDVEFECEDGVITYDVDFYCGSIEYEFEIDATLGTVIEYESDGDGYENGSSGYISKSEAKTIALNKAGLKASEIYDYDIELDDGEYEIEFKYRNMEYEIDIDAKTGKVLKFDKEYDD